MENEQLDLFLKPRYMTFGSCSIKFLGYWDIAGGSVSYDVYVDHENRYHLYHEYRKGASSERLIHTRSSIEQIVQLENWETFLEVIGERTT